MSETEFLCSFPVLSHSCGVLFGYVRSPWPAPSSIQLHTSESAGNPPQHLSSLRAHVPSLTESGWCSLVNISEIHHFCLSISTKITLVQGTIFIFLENHRSLLTGPAVSMLAVSNLLIAEQLECLSNHNLLMSFPSLKIFKLLPVDLKIETKHFSKSYKVSFVPNATTIPCVFLSSNLLPSFCHASVVSVSWACQTPSYHWALHLLFPCLAHSSFMSSHPEFVLISQSVAQLSLPWPPRLCQIPFCKALKYHLPPSRVYHSCNFTFIYNYHMIMSFFPIRSWVPWGLLIAWS